MNTIQSGRDYRVGANRCHCQVLLASSRAKSGALVSRGGHPTHTWKENKRKVNEQHTKTQKYCITFFSKMLCIFLCCCSQCPISLDKWRNSKEILRSLVLPEVLVSQVVCVSIPSPLPPHLLKIVIKNMHRVSYAPVALFGCCGGSMPVCGFTSETHYWSQK